MYYWYNLSCGNESIIRPFAGDIVTIYAMDKTIGAIQNKIQRQAKAWPDKYNPDDVYVVKNQKKINGLNFMVIINLLTINYGGYNE